MKFSLHKWIVKLFVAYAATVIFLPKIGFGNSQGIYVWEIICLPLVCAIILLKMFRVAFLRFFFLYCFMSLVSFGSGWVIYGNASWLWFFKLLKYFSLVSIAGLPFCISGFRTLHVRFILYSQLFFVILFGGYVIWHTITYPVSTTVLSSGYSPEYRLIGLTGRTIDLTQPLTLPDLDIKTVISRSVLKEIGPTSVQMGVHLSVLCSIFLSLYLMLQKRKYLWMALAMFIGTGLCYSRSGLLVLLISLIGLCLKKYTHFLLCYLSGIIVVCIFFFGVLPESVTSFGVLAKVSEQGFTDQTRLNFWGYALDRLITEPWIWIFGIGFGNIVSGTLEGLMLDTLIQSGVIALIFIVLFIFNLWKVTHVSYRDVPLTESKTQFALAVLNGIHVAIPGIFVALTVGGNMLFTDFIAPSFFLILGICLKEKQSLRCHPSTSTIGLI